MPADPDDALLVDLGRLLARIHEVGARRPSIHRPTMDPIDFGLGNLRWVIDAIPIDLRSRYAARVESIARESETLYRSIPTHRVHGDFYAENCILGPRGPVAIDFDDMMTGPAVQDVWILARPPRGRTDPDEMARRRDVILRGYREVRPFDDAWLALVPSLRALRAVWMSAWVTSRWFDPLFHADFRGWDEREHWQAQLDFLCAGA